MKSGISKTMSQKRVLELEKELKVVKQELYSRIEGHKSAEMQHRGFWPDTGQWNKHGTTGVPATVTGAMGRHEVCSS